MVAQQGTAPARRNLGRSVLICVAWSLAVFLVGGLAEKPAIMIAPPFLLCLGLIWLGTQLRRRDTARTAAARSEPERDNGIPG